MSLIFVVLIAIGLAMDAFAVSISCGMKIKHVKFTHAFKVALFFGVFQAVMPILGWLAGINLKNLIESIDHWIAFGLLAIIGSRMIYEAFKNDSAEIKINPKKKRVLLLLAIATSIDALAIGLGFALLQVKIIQTVLIIGLITFGLSFVGVYIGKKFGYYFGKKMELLGGVILLFIGFKILIEHLFFQ